MNVNPFTTSFCAVSVKQLRDELKSPSGRRYKFNDSCSFDLLKGRTFTAQRIGEETTFLDENGHPVNSISQLIQSTHDETPLGFLDIIG